MTDIPIIFSAPMVRALLDGRKTMTRRLAWRETNINREPAPGATVISSGTKTLTTTPWQKTKPGDRLWVRETCKAEERADGYDGVRYVADGTWVMIEDSAASADRWVDLNHYRKQRGATVPPIHMPRWASRLTLTVTGVKIERLQEISRADAIAEGLQLVSQEIEQFFRWPEPFHENIWLSPRAAFQWLWNTLHGAGSWDANPEVVAISFKVVKQNIDAIAAKAA